jgi:hypothetical protein
MVDTAFTLVSGTYTDEQHLLFELDFFIVETIGGWNRVKVVTDTATDKNIAYYTDGSLPGEFDRFWMRIRATADELRFNAMSLFDPSSDTDSDAFGGGAGHTEMTLTTSSGTYWFAANEDAVHVLVERASDGLSLHGGFGYFVSYYSAAQDPKPFYAFGQTALNITFSSHDRLYAYGPHSWGLAYSPTYSGTARSYFATQPSQIQYGTPNPRSGQPKLVEPVFYSDATFGAEEVRGEVPGLYMCGGTGLLTGNLITIDRMPPTVSGSYLIHRHTDATSWAIGPVTVSGGA